MKRGAIKIENNIVSVELVGGTVWLSQHQIAELFGVFVSAVNNNVRAILKSGVLDEEQVCRDITAGNGDIRRLYNLEMITAIAFRVRSEQTEIFRKWILKIPKQTLFLWHNTNVSRVTN